MRLVASISQAPYTRPTSSVKDRSWTSRTAILARACSGVSPSVAKCRTPCAVVAVTKKYRMNPTYCIHWAKSFARRELARAPDGPANSRTQDATAAFFAFVRMNA